MLRTLLCCLLLLSPDSSPLAGASSATESGTQDTVQANDFSGPQAVADNSSGDDPEQAWIGLPTLFLSDGYSPVITWPSFNDQYLPLSPIRAPPAA